MNVIAVYTPKRASRPKRVPLMLSAVRAGFPSPADDFIEKPLDLTQYLVRNHAATFLIRAKGDSMTEMGIRDGAILVVDRSLEVRDGCVVIAVVEGSFTVKRFCRRGAETWLEPATLDPTHYPAIHVTDPDAMVWGVVTSAINRL